MPSSPADWLACRPLRLFAGVRCTTVMAPERPNTASARRSVGQGQLRLNRPHLQVGGTAPWPARARPLTCPQTTGTGTGTPAGLHGTNAHPWSSVGTGEFAFDQIQLWRSSVNVSQACTTGGGQRRRRAPSTSPSSGLVHQSSLSSKSALGAAPSAGEFPPIARRRSSFAVGSVSH